jgi:hypothetical protein
MGKGGGKNNLHESWTPVTMPNRGKMEEVKQMANEQDDLSTSSTTRRVAGVLCPQDIHCTPRYLAPRYP